MKDEFSEEGQSSNTMKEGAEMPLKHNHTIYEVQSLICNALDEISNQESCADEQPTYQAAKSSALGWANDNGYLGLLGNVLCGIDESIGYPVSPKAVLFAMNNIIDHNILYISSKAEPRLFPYHLLAILTGSDIDRISRATLYEDEWDKLKDAISKLATATFEIANWHRLTLAQLDRRIARMRRDRNRHPLVVIDDALLLQNWQAGVDASHQGAVDELDLLAKDHGAMICLVLPRLAHKLN